MFSKGHAEICQHSGKSWECHCCFIKVQVTVADKVEFSHIILYLKYSFPLHTTSMKYAV